LASRLAAGFAATGTENGLTNIKKIAQKDGEPLTIDTVRSRLSIILWLLSGA
jgi:hypothetical protein